MFQNFVHFHFVAFHDRAFRSILEMIFKTNKLVPEVWMMLFHQKNPEDSEPFVWISVRDLLNYLALLIRMSLVFGITLFRTDFQVATPRAIYQ